MHVTFLVFLGGRGVLGFFWGGGEEVPILFSMGAGISLTLIAERMASVNDLDEVRANSAF